MARLTIELETLNPEDVRSAYRTIMALIEFHYPKKQVQTKPAQHQGRELESYDLFPRVLNFLKQAEIWTDNDAQYLYERNKLQLVRGIGKWTVQYLLEKGVLH